MWIDFMQAGFQEMPDRTAVVWNDREYTYGWFSEAIPRWIERIRADGVAAGDVVALRGDFSPGTVALLLALIEAGVIVTPLAASATSATSVDARLEIARVQAIYDIDERDDAMFERLPHDGQHELFDTLRSRGHPGLVLFTSGSSGQPKAAVHDLVGLLEKFYKPRTAFRTLNFLLFDHWGGLNTMFHTLSNGGAVIAVDDRTPDRVCELIERFGADLLPTSPTFLNLLLVGHAHERYDISSLRVITYGTEPMPQSTLDRLSAAFPNVKIQQTYGLIELGVLRAKSKDRQSLWVRIGGEGYETRVRHGLLEIKARSAMLGYLNAPSPFTDDGWFMTGDAVEVEGDYFRILGRKSELINVGGEKVYPAEVESVLQELDNVREVTVFAEPNAITGNIVCARARLVEPEPLPAFTARLKTHCRGRMERFKIPVRVEIVESVLFNDRFKKARICHARTFHGR